MATLTVIAGPNGSGKSTVFSRLQAPGEVINTDDFARRLDPVNPEGQSIRAARAVLARIVELLSAGLDFNFETTLSSRQSLAVMQRAKARGYRLELAYIVLRSPQLHLARVRQRVALGGHDIPDDIILRRYDRSLKNLGPAVRLADQTIVYDNTEPELKTLVLKGRTGTISSLQEWRALNETLATAIADAAGIDLASR